MAKIADFKIDNLPQFMRRIKTKNRKLKRRGGLGGPYHMAAQYVHSWIGQNFKTEGKKAYPGTGWKKLSPVTLGMIAETARGGKGKKSVEIAKRPKILQDVGTLRSDWKTSWNHKEAVVESTATAKGGYYYGMAHDQGKKRVGKVVKTGRNRKVKLPQRKILPEEKQIAKKIKEIFGYWIRVSIK